MLAKIVSFIIISSSLSSGFFSECSQAADFKPKYGPEAIPLSESHEYFQKHSAPVFWALIPYYSAQQTHTSCSAATVTMLVNAARAGLKRGPLLGSDDKLTSESDLLEKVNQGKWKKDGSALKQGVPLDEFKPLIEASFIKYGITPLSIEVVHVDQASDPAKKKLQATLSQFENSKDHLILINFNQGVYTGDASVGHYAPIAAYDSEKKRVLILDPDREWYEPYWVSEETLIKGMNTLDSQSGHKRGYIVIKLPTMPARQ